MLSPRIPPRAVAIPCAVVALVLAGAMPPAATAADLLINELLASNFESALDEDGDSSDWLELYNPGGVPVEVGGYTLSDDPTDPGRWTLPPRTIAAHGYLTIWASGKDRRGPGELHTNFKLDREGETVLLVHPSGTILDRVTFGPQLTDRSLGRFPDGSTTFVIAEPTPGDANRDGTVPPGSLECDVADGFYPHGASLRFSTDVPGADILYTLDGSEPGPGDATYRRPIDVEATGVVRARVFTGPTPRTVVVTRTIIVDAVPHLPVVSLAVDPDALYDAETGIFENPLEHGREWERPCHATLIEDGDRVLFSAPAGLRVHGNSSRRRAKKSLRLYFRAEYGASDVEEQLFPMKPVERFDRLVLHSGAGDQPRHGGTLVKDAITAEMLHEAGGNVSAFRPVNVLLNGQSWGVYWLREYLDDHYVETNFGIDRDDVDLFYDQAVRAGDDAFRDDTMRFFDEHRFRDDAMLEEAALYVDLDDLINYQIVEIFVANWDWPHHNVIMFSDRTRPGPWRWALWDVDNAWNPNDVADNSLAWAIRDRIREDLGHAGTDHDYWVRSTLILRRLLDNDGFRARFVNRFADLLNASLSSAALAAAIDAMQATLTPDIDRELDRWADDTSVDDWQRRVDRLVEFAGERPAHLRTQLRQELDAGVERLLTVEAPASGEGGVRVNTIEPTALPWSGTYFSGVPVTIEALPAPGFAFDGWNDPALPASPIVEIELDRSRTVQPRFIGAPNGAPVATLDIATTDEDVAVTIALLANDYDADGDPLRYLGSFDVEHGMVSDAPGNGVVVYTPPADWSGVDGFRYAISDDGDHRTEGRVEVTVRAVNDPPGPFRLLAPPPGVVLEAGDVEFRWTASTDVDGPELRYTVHVRHGTVDTTLAAADTSIVYTLERRDGPIVFVEWSVSATDGIAERVADDQRGGFSMVDTRLDVLPTRVRLLPRAPNPFTPNQIARALVRFELPGDADVDLTIFDLQGRRIATLIDETLPGGLHVATWDGRNQRGDPVASGVYLVRLQAGSTTTSGKLVLLR